MSSSYEANGYMPNNHDVLQQHRSDFDAFQTNTITTTAKPKRKRESTLRKAPGAPKRFKSSYILFFMAQRDGIKRELGPKASVGDISKRSSEKWKGLSPEEKKVWEDKAEADKRRYKLEKERYTGPWQVPFKRAKKNPNAPKRPMSAFLYFSQEKRSMIKEQNPGLKNTEISRVLGQMWKNAPEAERTPHIEHEKMEREKYKAEMATWREKEEERKALIREKNEEQLQNYTSRPPKVMYEERTEPIPLSVASHHNPASNDEHYGQYHNAYSGYYPPPSYSYAGNSEVSHPHYNPSHYQNWNSYSPPEDERQGYYSDDYKPIPYDQDQHHIQPEKRYARESNLPHTNLYQADPTPTPQHYSYEHHHHSGRQMGAPTISAASFEGDGEEFGMQSPF